MRTVAITLGDNDFGNTFRPLLETVFRGIDWNSSNLTEKVITEGIRSGIEFHYRMFQLGNGLGDPGYGPVERTVTYLNLGIKILFDNDAEDDIAMRDHDGGAWYLEIPTGKVYSY